jgi:hypothetical protein
MHTVMHVKHPNTGLEEARLRAIDVFSAHLTSEIVLAQNADGFFDKRYWNDYLDSKYAYQNSMNEFYCLLHELSK